MVLVRFNFMYEERIDGNKATLAQHQLPFMYLLTKTNM